MLNFLQSAGGVEKTGITPTLILPHQGGGESLVVEQDAPRGSAGRLHWFLENPVLWAGSESIGYAENMIKGD